MPQPVRVFFSYSHEDEPLRSQLARHLRLLERQDVIESWFDRKILPGESFDTAIQRELERAEVVLFLVSSDFVASEYCYGVEMKRALERSESGEALVVPIIVRACDWHTAPFGQLKALPEDGKPVTSWANQDEAWADVAKELRRLLEHRPSRPGEVAATKAGAAADPKRYLETLDSDNSWVELRGMGAQVAERLPLDRVYTRLRVGARRGGPDGSGKEGLEEEGRGKRGSEAGFERLGREQEPSLAEVLRENPSAVLIGHPGSGKTTFLRFVAQKLARELLGAEKGQLEEALGLSGDAPFPIFVRLSEVADFLVKNPKPDLPEHAPEHLLRFLDFSLRGHLHGLPENDLRNRLVQGGCFLLLDGLDEVSAPARPRIAAMVDRLVVELGTKNRYLLTCRTRAYEGRACLAALPSFALADFGPQQVEQFVKGWCRALHRVEEKGSESQEFQEAEVYRKKLQGAIEAHPNTGPLTSNPLMLTMLAVVHWNHRKLPEQRAKLYAVAVNYLLESRGEQSEFTPHLRVGALQALALRMFEDEEGLQRSYGLESAAEAVQEALCVESLQQARSFLEEETLHSGLLVEHSDGEVEFWHLTFQEYLAARELAASGEWQELEEARLFHDQWNEVILLLGGCLVERDGPRRARELLKKILATGRNLPSKARAVGLAGRLLRDVRAYGGDPAQQTGYEAMLKETLSIFEPPRPGQKIVAEALRIEVGEALGQAGDPRLENPEQLFVDLPGGTFLMGAQKQDPKAPGYDKEAFDDEGPPHRVTLSPFRIGRYPVTVEQYLGFVEAQELGYFNPRHWDPKGWAWREYEGIKGPEEWAGQLRHRNRPVVGVSWYEADAYCRWTGGSLPTEAQWEFAARGTGSRKYPWGEEPPTDGHANFDSNVGHATPVGIYPLGPTPEGLHDLGGNVWEWCQDWWVGSNSADEVVNPGGPPEGPSRVIRGGSFYFNAVWLRGAFRSYYLQEFRNFGVGFRVVFG